MRTAALGRSAGGASPSRRGRDGAYPPLPGPPGREWRAATDHQLLGVAPRFFFTVTLDRPELSRRFVLVRHPRRLPTVLSVEEVGRLLERAPGPKYRAALGTAYGAGLRVSEVATLKIGDIDNTRMLIRAEQGKGRKDRNAMLSPQLLELLRLWWREGKRRGVMLPQGWLFPGRSPLEPISTRQINRAVHESRSWSRVFRFGSSALLPARRRDRSVQAERGFAGTRNATKLTALQGNFVCRFGWKPLGVR